MSAPMALRTRFTLLATLLGFVLSGLAALTTVSMTEDYEYVLANEILRGQAEDYGLRLANGLPAQLPRTQRLSGYRMDSPELPQPYAAYPLGVREDAANHDTHVGVFETAAGRLVFTIDLGDIETLEIHLRLLVIALVAIGTLLAGWLGWLLSGIALKPVRVLAEQVDGLPVEPRQTRLADDVSRDDLGRLAGAIDDYQRRLVQADAHEQAFFADASHELRTPIAVVYGTTEVMLDDIAPGSDPGRVARLRRLERGVREMNDLIDMLLVVARRRPLDLEPVEAVDLLHDALHPLHAGSASAEIEVVAAGTLQVPRHQALLLLRHAVGKLGWPSSGKTLSMRLVGNRLDVGIRAGEGASSAPGRSDTGGLGALAQRLALQIGWRIRHATSDHIILELPDDAGAPLAVDR